MKKLFLLSVLFVLFTSCAESTKFGDCVGFGKYQDPNLVYEISTQNAIVTAFFCETLVVPVIWALEYAYCPVAKKK